ncbi:DUF1223 domain-containing protein [Paraburkholderia sp. SARCC-3016]|uniref:DUF1223 domain-containing protein n=1 Tax=Paraburkholderia sp. SARCC-3016 TaxID=3058611 RepID=UPI0028072F6D|nr:DUF1223 domain-containing protein [Paraburkholderia sp. SARCC-3016]MDQ7980478.1 DUF1223 domain-containing protein [Paraburkholderia sp. SARCC-3016]
MRIPTCLAHAALLVSGIAVTAHAAPGRACSVASPAHRVALVELYTSEGCNSCPPADNWLSQLNRTRHRDAVVPLALHVDYWDNADWRDRFAQPAFTARQKYLSSKGGSHIVYTPAVFVGGEELRGWSSDTGFGARVEQLDAQPAPADIRIGAQSSASGMVAFDARIDARTPLPSDAFAYVAVYEDGLKSDIKGGENAGATLHHDRVTRNWFGPVPVVGGHARLTGSYAIAPSAKQGVVAFVERASTGEVLQVAELARCDEAGATAATANSAGPAGGGANGTARAEDAGPVR